MPQVIKVINKGLFWGLKIKVVLVFKTVYLQCHYFINVIPIIITLLLSLLLLLTILFEVVVVVVVVLLE